MPTSPPPIDAGLPDRTPLAGGLLSDTTGSAVINDLPHCLPVTLDEIELLYAAFASRLDDLFATARKE